MNEINIKDLFKNKEGYAIKNKVTINIPHATITYEPLHKNQFGTITKPTDPILVSKSINGYQLHSESISPDNPLYDKFIIHETVSVYDDTDILRTIPDDSYWESNDRTFWFKDKTWYGIGSRTSYKYNEGTIESLDMNSFTAASLEYIVRNIILKNILNQDRINKSKLIRVTPIQEEDHKIYKQYKTELDIDKIKDTILPVTNNPLIGMRYKKKTYRYSELSPSSTQDTPNKYNELSTGYIFDILVRESEQSNTWYESGETKITYDIEQFMKLQLNRPDATYQGELMYIWSNNTEPIAVVNPSTNHSEILPMIFNYCDPMVYINGEWVSLRNTEYSDYDLYHTTFVKV